MVGGSSISSRRRIAATITRLLRCHGERTVMTKAGMPEGDVAETAYAVGRRVRDGLVWGEVIAISQRTV